MATVLLRAQEVFYASYQSLGKCTFRTNPESQMLTDTSDEGSAQRKQKSRQLPDRGCSSGPARSKWNHLFLNLSCQR